MPSWDEVKRMFRQAVTPEEREEVAQALGEHIPEEHENKLLGTMRKGGHAVRLGGLPDAMSDPQVYNTIKKAVGEGEAEKPPKEESVYGNDYSG